jgi:hypothetical protein
MRVAILGESRADEVALRILVDAVLQLETTPVAIELRSRGWPYVRNALPAVIRFLYYRTDAEGLVVIADSNHTSVVQNDPKNRLRELQEAVRSTKETFSVVPGRVPLRFAVGVASPALEAWFLCKRHPEVDEAKWEKGLLETRDPYSRPELKRRLYGSDIPSLDLEIQQMVQAANELRTDIVHLERQFPNGFGNLARQLREWQR